jgi:hypothetical protein
LTRLFEREEYAIPLIPHIFTRKVKLLIGGTFQLFASRFYFTMFLIALANFFEKQKFLCESKVGFLPNLAGVKPNGIKLRKILAKKVGQTVSLLTYLVS